MLAFQPFLQHFAPASDTASCQDYEEKEFVECFSKETQIIDIFTHCKLHRRTGNFLRGGGGGGGGGGAVNYLPKKLSQVAQIFTKQQKRNEAKRCNNVDRTGI